jgi:nitrogen fixation protein NifU and related proteins
MSDLRDLYQEVILDHSKHPRNFRALEHASCSAKGYNPLCGDRVTVFVTLEGGVVRDVAFQGAGCAICTASASMMTQALKGRTEAQADALFERFHHMLTIGEAGGEAGGGKIGEPMQFTASDPELGKLTIFAGVREFPIRVKCATLPWHTFHAALQSQGGTVTTE